MLRAMVAGGREGQGAQVKEQNMFTEQELAKMALADREIEAGFHLDMEDMVFSKELDRVAKLESVLPEKRKLAEYQKAYYEANREKNHAAQ